MDLQTCYSSETIIKIIIILKEIFIFKEFEIHKI
jgi:hypothetical protein